MQPAALATGRATGALWNGGGMPGGLLAVSVYLQCSVGMDPGNRKILADLAVELRTCGRPYVIGGDWNSTPEAVRASGILELFNAELACPWSVRDKAAETCRASSGEWRTLDFPGFPDLAQPVARMPGSV